MAGLDPRPREEGARAYTAWVGADTGTVQHGGRQCVPAFVAPGCGPAWAGLATVRPTSSAGWSLQSPATPTLYFFLILKQIKEN